MTKIQITLTMEEEYRTYIRNIATTQFEGNESMAIRKIIADHSRKTNFKEAQK